VKPDAVEAVIAGLKDAGVSIVCYLPDSLLKELYVALDADPEIRTIRVTNEGENNGWAIPHGMTMEPLLQAMRIPYRIVEEASAIRRAVAECYAWSYASYYHSALVLGGSVVR
jgi:sulfopyruvate decarboxylase subunit alpha